jgi:hypothetical protein
MKLLCMWNAVAILLSWVFFEGGEGNSQRGLVAPILGFRVFCVLCRLSYEILAGMLSREVDLVWGGNTF